MAEISEEARAAAQEQARAGAIGDAVQTLETAADAGDVSAAYSLAEIHAFRGEWSKVIDRLVPLCAQPDALSAGNMKRDAAGLLWRAAEATGRWSDARAQLSKLPEQAVGGLLFASLGPYLESEGKAGAPVLSGLVGTTEERRAQYLVKVGRSAGKPVGIFVSASNDPDLDAEAVAAFPAARELLNFNQTLAAARSLVRVGKLDDAWAAVVAKSKGWTAIDASQIAPAVLLWDPDLRPMMTPARCAEVLARNAK